MDPNIFKYLILGVGGVFAVMVIAFLKIRSKMMGKKTKYVASLTSGTKSSGFSMEVLYQKLWR